jgi:hypothetical protein
MYNIHLFQKGYLSNMQRTKVIPKPRYIIDFNAILKLLLSNKNLRTRNVIIIIQITRARWNVVTYL